MDSSKCPACYWVVIKDVILKSFSEVTLIIIFYIFTCYAFRTLSFQRNKQTKKNNVFFGIQILLKALQYLSNANVCHTVVLNTNPKMFARGTDGRSCRRGFNFFTALSPGGRASYNSLDPLAQLSSQSWVALLSGDADFWVTILGKIWASCKLVDFPSSGVLDVDRNAHAEMPSVFSVAILTHRSKQP